MTEKLSVVYATPSVSRLYTGVYEVERNVALELFKLDIAVEIFGLEDKFTAEDLVHWLPLVPSVHKVRGPSIIGYSDTYLKALLNSTGNVGHIHALWSYSSYALYKWSKQKNHPYLLTANGYLDEWALNNSKVKKKIALKFVFNKILTEAGCIQVNSEHEYQSVRNLGLTNPVCLISNGVNLPDLSLSYDSPWQNIQNTKNKKILLYLSRIHQKKGVHLLLEAWNHLNSSDLLKDWNLVIVGFSCPTSAYEEKIRDYIKNNKLEETVTTLEGQYGADMLSCYSNCDAFILPSFSEGAAIAALNAWAFSKPTIITPQCNLSDGYRFGASFEAQPETQSIIHAILKLINSTPEERKLMGKRGRDMVEMRYSWKAITLKLLEIYNWLHLDRKVLPSTLVKD
jgi:poly(glycerol-phosphate) alpha-glucosyltransferase